jgi:AcrR family transcriptional regulator
MTQPRTRRRGALLEDAILDAAADELLDVGYGGFTMAAVAKRAGTNKNAIYRRWPGRAALAVAAYRHMAVDAPPLPDTGSLRTDVLETLRRINGQWSSPVGRLLKAIVASAAEDQELMALITGGSIESSSDMWMPMIERAVARGEALPDALHPRVATVPIALLRNEHAIRGSLAVPDHVLIEIVDRVFLPLVRMNDQSQRHWR